jgi:hypothetical protein
MSSPAPHGPSRQPTGRQRLPRLAGDAVERARLRVVPRTARPPARVPFIGLVSLILLTGVVGLLLFNTSLQQASFATTALEAEADTLGAREQALRMEIAEQRDPQRIAERAQQMGMVIPTVPTFLTLDGDVRGERVAAVETDRFSIEPAPAPNPYGTLPSAAPEPTPDRTGGDDARADGASSSGSRGDDGSNEDRSPQRDQQDGQDGQ